ncbi:MAG TPA: pirin-like C-terminal cupin domain-containing protein, partial [Candidatus Krumholzibacteria bacterium]
HSEMPEQEHGLMQGFQLWINLHSSEKLSDPAYEEIAPDGIPSHTDSSGAHMKIIAGEVDGVRGPIGERRTKPLYLDLRLEPHAEFSQAIPVEHNALAYVFEGSLIDGSRGEIGAHQLIVFGTREGHDGVAVSSGGTGARLLLLAGQPLNEPIAQWGPFVMNTRQEIEQAIAAYRDGSLTR